MTATLPQALHGVSPQDLKDATPQHLNAATSQWYNAHPKLEDGRLREHRIEYEVTLRSILAHLPNKPGLKILDIGGGAGPYTFALAARGHTVTLVDLTSSLLALAHTRTAALPPSARPARILQGDATDLLGTVTPLADEAGTFDAVLLLGPLYHIMTLELRTAALAQAWDMVRPGSIQGVGSFDGESGEGERGGILACAWVSRHAHYRDVAMREPARLAARRDLYAQHARDGGYARVDDEGKAYFAMHHELPEAMPGLLRAATGGAQVRMVGAEGVLAGGLDKLVNELQGDEFEAWVRKCLDVGSDEHGWMMSDHIIGIATKP